MVFSVIEKSATDAVFAAMKFLADEAGHAVRKADRLLTEIVQDEATQIEKTVWGSPAGKKLLADRLVKLIPAHRIYVEPFAGSGAVFFAKEPVDKEVLNDADPEIAFAFRFLKGLTPKKLKKLERKNWIGSKAAYQKLVKQKTPKDELERFYRFVYLSHFSYGKMRGKSFNPNAQGTRARSIKRIEQFAPRLKNVEIRNGDYEKVIKDFDGKDTFFFLDPPYAGHDVQVGEDRFDEERFRKALESIRGKFLLTYGTKGKLDVSGFRVKRIMPPRNIRSMAGVGGPAVLPTLLVTNYEYTEKNIGDEDDGWSLVDVNMQDNPLLVFSEKPSKKDAVLQLHFLGRSLHGDLRIKANDHLVGWTLSIMKPGAVKDEVNTLEQARRIASSFSLQGNGYTKSMAAPDKIAAFPKPVHPVEWLQIDEEVIKPGSMGATRHEEGVIVAVDRPKVELGIQKSDFHEYFFSRGKVLNGILSCRLITGKKQDSHEEAEADRAGPGETYWTCFISKSNLPSVLKQRAVESGIMPPDGHSAIPQTLEQVTPKEYRYWLSKGEKAQKIRDALVESGFFTEENVKLVDGEFRRVVKKYFLFTGEKPGSSQKAVDHVQVEEESSSEVTKKLLNYALEKGVPLIKTKEERYVLGVVLEPETVDAQKDIYSAEEVRKAAHGFMEYFARMHHEGAGAHSRWMHLETAWRSGGCGRRAWGAQPSDSSK